MLGTCVLCRKHTFTLDVIECTVGGRDSINWTVGVGSRSPHSSVSESVLAGRPLRESE